LAYSDASTQTFLQKSKENQLHLVWQDSCHEAFLLQHLDGRSAARPPSSELALQASKRAWPEYSKGMAAMQLTARIDLNAVLRAGLAEPALTAFLHRICLR
jgi:hypothetical protein